MNKLLLLLLLNLFFVFSNFLQASDIFIDTFDIAVGRNHVCTNTSAGIKCFGNAEKATLRAPIKGKNPRHLQVGNRFSCMIVDEGIKCWGEIPNSKKTEILIGNKTIKNPKLLSVGYEHACAVSSNEKIKCWGNNEYGELNPPSGLSNITEISLGMNNSCVIASNRLVCWGMSIEGTTNFPSDITNPKNLTSGWWHHCVQSDDGIKCWGYPYKDFVIPDDISIKVFSSGGLYNCAITDIGVKCWDESGKTSFVEDSMGASKLSVGANIGCAVTNIKGVICWRLGIISKGNYQLLKSFVPAGGITDIKFVSASHASTCVFGDNNNLKCWGFNPDNALDVPSTLVSQITELSVGPHKTCTISDSLLSCWGDRNSAYDIPKNLGEVRFVSSGGNQVCAGTHDQLRCWGENIRGALDIPKNLSQISQISSGLTHVCAIANQKISCWGGEGLIKNINPPLGLPTMHSVCAGGTFSCGLSSKGKIQCWGDKIQFVGDTNSIDHSNNGVLSIPVEVQNSAVQEISCGLSHACAIYNGKIKCWGDSQFLPERLSVPVVKNPRQISSGWNHSCVLDDKGLSCWGSMLNIEMPSYSLEKN
ncbi:MAG: RCC1 domain-containing protein [Bacteriovorax sp.]|nr:RCC1 domain-containing protein [Bacteriovorax sp.]